MSILSEEMIEKIGRAVRNHAEQTRLQTQLDAYPEEEEILATDWDDGGDDDETDRILRALFREHGTALGVARAVGWPRETARRRLRQLGLAMPPRGRPGKCR